MFDFDVREHAGDAEAARARLVGEAFAISTLRLDVPVGEIPRGPALILSPETGVAAAMAAMRRRGAPADIAGAYAGLRPLVAGRSGETADLSRRHVIYHIAPGITGITGIVMKAERQTALNLKELALSIKRKRQHGQLSLRDVAVAEQHFRDAGIEILDDERPIEGVRRFFLRDPGGNRIEVTEAAPES